MLNITALLRGSCQEEVPRYGEGAHRRPVVVWNSTLGCNLACWHCYYGASSIHPLELRGEEALSLIDDLADYGAQALIVSGGEPLFKPGIFKLLERAVEGGLRVALSTNGTLIDPATARLIKDLGVSYVGISLDGAREEVHDGIRGVRGSFALALQGIRSCLEAGLKTGIRFTMSRSNLKEIRAIFSLADREGVQRLCFYHLVGVGRAEGARDQVLGHEESRWALRLIIREAERLVEEGSRLEVLTVDNHADGPYLYLRLLEEDEAKARRALEMMRRNGGNSSGQGLACIDALGIVHPDQFWLWRSLGSIRERPFSQIWSDESIPLLKALRNRRELLKGRCGRCPFLEICNGNLRARAEAYHGDPWAPDPACYLSDEELSVGLSNCPFDASP